MGHKFNKEVIDEKATYEKEGKKHMECSVCGAKDESSHVSISKLIKQGTEGKDKDSVSDGSTVTKTTETNSKTKIDTPDTSDSSNAIFYGLIAIIAIAGVGGTIFKIKRVS